MNEKNKRFYRLVFVSSIVLNIAVLGFFKYFHFFAQELASLLHQFGIGIEQHTLNIVLPIGISFYTFHGLSYVIDCYKKRQTELPTVIEYAVFVSFFPLLVAGPIERAQHLLPQIQRKRQFNEQQWIEGSRLMLWGFFKKVVIADSLAQVANPIFADYSHMSPLLLLIGTLAFSFQIYGDFSGYSDIATGTAKLMGFELLSNFKFPYFSENIADFWRRWHISLSSWFKDYLYIPLGGSKNGTTRTILNTFLIFVVSGFWHGASWNFIAWGTLHALFFMPSIFRKKTATLALPSAQKNPIKTSFIRGLRLLRTFSLVALAWNFFRIPTLTDAFAYSQRLLKGLFQFDFSISHPEFALNALWWIPIFLLIDGINRQNERQFLVPKWRVFRWALYLAMTLCIFMFSNKDQQFLYFQF
ncbi:MAG: hypothetical protein RLZZ301_857 [Bacteroidota bacterium]